MNLVGPRRTANIQSVEKGALHTNWSAQQLERTGSNIEAQYWTLATLLALARTQRATGSKGMFRVHFQYIQHKRQRVVLMPMGK
ncbi:uncharacterized protein Bfra_004059 [Botrytis fragariae]|uniref:Uncharacterized protein n=1 Tax=Botrytis fragariae TaxID=1964551 RepID=A0A8H6EJ17_9HELO|nr:uncharacterized protein Bfra_004059 [Botrytis fragariae]KAF5874053.1 hypothetical protein Bfra_004059 [Botrytis fragariae]